MSVIYHPLTRIVTTLFLAALIISPFVNDMIKDEYNDLVISTTYFTVATYVVVKKIYDVFRDKV